MKNIKYVAHRLIIEYKSMHRPDRKTLMKDSTRIVITAVVTAVILKAVDTGFAALLTLIL